MPRPYKHYCSVYGCLNSSLTKPGITFFRLPPDSERLSEWIKLMCRDDLVNKSKMASYRVCEIHFKEQHILPTSNRKLLKKNAVPTLNLPDFQITVEEKTKKEDKETQTEIITNESYTQTKTSRPCGTPRKSILKTELLKGGKKSKLNETAAQKTQETLFHDLCDKFLTKELALQVKAQTRLKFHGKGKRNDQD